MTDIETEVIKSFSFKNLYNFKKEAKSMLGYKHTAEAKKMKMKKRLSNNFNHSMYNKKHTIQALRALSKSGKLNPIYNKIHSIEIRHKMSISHSKIPLGLYNKENNLIKTYINQIELATEFNVFKTTISRYIKSGKIFKNNYFIWKLNNNNNNNN